MALTGLQIQKLLPGTNCKECGSNTCMAFAMKLAAKKADLALCPYASDEAKRVLGEATEPPVKTVVFGPEGKCVTGDETVLYRHEKTFVHPTIFAVNVCDTDSEEVVAMTLSAVKGYLFERVGESFTIDMVSVTQRGSDTAAFLKLAERSHLETGKPLVLRSPDIECLRQAARLFSGKKFLLCADLPSSALDLVEAAKEHSHALAVTAPEADGIAALTSSLRESGFNDMVLRFNTHSLSERFQTGTIARRSAIKDSFRPMGFPMMRFIEDGDMLDGTIAAATEVLKYGGICVLPRFDAAQMASLMTLRLNIFTDPQKPIQVEPKLYAIGEPSPSSPLFVTTNFSLTFFVVSGEIENSGVSAWLAIPECEGMSVLTAWAAGKFSAASIAKFIRENDIESQLTCRTMVIPGYVSQLSGELEENLKGWTVLVGPQEASDLEGFIKARFAG